MSLLVVGSVRASPGATTTALAVAGCLPGAVVVEGDCDGGVLAVRYGLGRDPGLTTLAAAADPAAEPLLGHAQRLPGGVPALVGPDSPQRAVALWRAAGENLAAALSGGEGWVVADAGRLSPTSPAAQALVPAAGLVLVVARPAPEELVAVGHRLPELRSANSRVSLVLVGDGPYSPRSVVEEIGCAVMGVVAVDVRAARLLAEGGSVRALRRSALVRSARTLADAVTELATGPDPAAPGLIESAGPGRDRDTRPLGAQSEEVPR